MKPFAHIAGQHVDIRLTAPDGYSAMRSYSIASWAISSPTIELAIERLPDGEVSSFFHDVAAIGDPLTHGLRPEFAQHLAKTMRREPTEDDKAQAACESEAAELRSRFGRLRPLRPPGLLCARS